MNRFAQIIPETNIYNQRMYCWVLPFAFKKKFTG